MYNQAIKIVRKLSLDDVLDMVHTPRLANLVRAIWEGHPNKKIWFSKINMAAFKVSEWLSIGDHEWREDLPELEILLDLLEEREPQAIKSDEIKLQFMAILVNVILNNESPVDLISRWYDAQEEEELDGEDDATAD